MTRAKLPKTHLANRVQTFAPDLVRIRLLHWFEQHGRSFSWRRSGDAFTVLVAEILLRKTTAPTVDAFLPRFWASFPNINSLAVSDLCNLRDKLSPLGLSNQRAAQLRALATTLLALHDGKVPREMTELLGLPGVGPYTAGAVLSFAYNQPEPIVDANLARILVRLAGIEPSRYEARRSPEVWDLARTIIGTDGDEARLVNWALLDLGALVCKVRKPLCTACPLKKQCAFAESLCNAHNYIQ